MGDNYKGFRIIGTIPKFFNIKKRDSETLEGVPLFKLKEGKIFGGNFQAVIGSQVAQQTGLKMGDTFYGTHGLVSVIGSEEHREFPYEVVGVLDPSGSANDRAIFITLDSIWSIHEKHHHEDESVESEPENLEEDDDEGFEGIFAFASQVVGKKEKEVTAVLIQLESVGMRLWMVEEIKNETDSMAAIPINQMLKLNMQILGPIQKTLLIIAFLVVIVAALTILTTLYQAAERRRRDVAIMRTLGAKPIEIFSLVFLEASFLTFLGIVSGWVMGHGFIQLAAIHFQKNMGLSVNAWTIGGTEVESLFLVALCGLIAGVVPAVVNYRRSPVKDLSLV